MALIDPEFDAFFRRVIEALSPYLDELVLVGGCANMLYRHNIGNMDDDVPFIGTTDVDFASNERLLQAARPPLQSLLQEFDIVLSGNGTNPPIMKFVDASSELEFLCPLRGSETTRDGQIQQAILLQEGVSAQPLRYLELLLFDPWTIELGSVPGFEGCPDVRVPNPMCYVIQKILIHNEPRRKILKGKKDCYYIYEIAVMFRARLNELVDIFCRLPLAPGIPSAWLTRFVKEFEELFSSENAYGPDSAVKVFSDAGLTLPGRDEESVTRLDPRMVHLSVQKLIQQIKRIFPV